MKSLADRFRQWYEHERDSNAKSLAMLASVPVERRTDPLFQKALDKMAHLDSTAATCAGSSSRFPFGNPSGISAD